MSAHTINRQIFEFTCHSEEMATRVQKEILHYTSAEITRIIGDVLASHLVQPGHYTINTLEIDLGDILVGDFGKADMLHHFSQLLKEKVQSLLNYQGPSITEDATTETDPELAITHAFLLHGDVPWWADKSSPIDIDAALERLIRRKPAAVKELLTHRSGSVPVIQRFFTQYKPSTLSLVKVLIPEVLDEFYSSGVMSAAGYQINRNQLYTSLRKHRSSTGKILSEEYKSKRLLKLLKTPFRAWAGSLQQLRVLSADELADGETMLNSLPKKDSRTLVTLKFLSKKLSLYHIEFLLQQAATFKARQVSRKKDAIETPATIEYVPIPAGPSTTPTRENSTDEEAIKAATDSLFPDKLFAKASKVIKPLDLPASDQSSGRAENEIANTAVTALEKHLFSETSRSESSPTSFQMDPGKHPPTFADKSSENENERPLAKGWTDTNESSLSKSANGEESEVPPLAPSSVVQLRKYLSAILKKLPDATPALSEELSGLSERDLVALQKLFAQLDDSTEAVLLKNVLKKKQLTTGRERSLLKKVLQGLSDETLGLFHGLTQLSEQEMKVLFYPTPATGTSTKEAHPVARSRFSEEQGLPRQQPSLADHRPLHSLVNNDPSLVRGRTESETRGSEPDTKLFRADRDKEPPTSAESGGKETKDRPLIKGLTDSPASSLVKPANADGSKVSPVAPASDAQLRKYVSAILKKLPGATPALSEVLSGLSERDLVALQNRFAQLDRSTDRRAIVESLLKHPDVFQYAWLDTFTNPAYQEGSSIEMFSKQAVLRKEASGTATLGKLMDAAHADILQAIQGLSSTEVEKLKQVLAKKPLATAPERSLLRKVLQGLSDDTLGLFHGLTQLSEQEMKALFYPAPATGTSPKEVASNAADGGVYFPEHQSRRILVENAGLCLIAPYLPALFNHLGYLDNKVFKSSLCAHKAMYLLQYMATGKRKEREFVLQLNKLICGFEAEDGILSKVRFLKSELTEADNMLESVITNWRMLKNTSVNGFRGSFLLRKGILLEGERHWTLQVERKEYDLLLNSLPWGFSLIKLPWMQKHIQVEW